MAALVTGASGFIGGHVARALVARGDRVRLFLRKTASREFLSDLDFELAEGDLRDEAAVTAAVAGCSVVYHVAADYRLWSPNPKDLYASNVSGTLNVLRASASAHVDRVVYTSSVGTLGIPPDGTPGSEETPVTVGDMVGHYKRSKFMAEAQAMEFAQAHRLSLVLVHPSTPVGELDIKPTPTGCIIVDYLNRRMPAYLDTGLNLIDVRDVAAGHLLAAERGIDYRKYILGNRNTTLKALLAELADITGRKPPWLRIPYSAALAAGTVSTFVQGNLLGRSPSIPVEGVLMARKLMYFNSFRAVTELGLPQSPVDAALRRAVNWYVKNGYADCRITGTV